MQTKEQLQVQVNVLRTALARISRTRECENGQVEPVYRLSECVEIASVTLEMLNEMEKVNEEETNT